MLAVGCLSLGAITACGSDGEGLPTEASPPHLDVSTCLERAGAEVEVREVDATSRMVEAQLPNGDLIFVGRLPSPGIADRTIQAVRKVRREEGLRGIMTASTVDRGSILILVIGREGVEGGLATPPSEHLARRCAIRTDARIGRPSTLGGGTRAEMRRIKSDGIERN